MVINNKMKKAQSFSTDIIVVVVIILFGSLFVVMSQINNVESGPSLEEKYEEASLEAKVVFENLKSSQIINSENQVDVDKLLTLNERELREELSLPNEFGIVFEKDGKLVKIDPENNVNCVGSSSIIVNGEECK